MFSVSFNRKMSQRQFHQQVCKNGLVFGLLIGTRFCEDDATKFGLLFAWYGAPAETIPGKRPEPNHNVKLNWKKKKQI